ncbi:MAG: hypothetical protein ETSY1_44430 [Candidatus Entotheonella factor]|uniref:Uncharacterized protein n=1 Tax=Entotheonella factor TaxID=1429438 RepID=W4L4L1_ENTF1|nr:MAG: hypothetical protein ETSY1_44430 [Candidatus Entotheonella factor]
MYDLQYVAKLRTSSLGSMLTYWLTLNIMALSSSCLKIFNMIAFTVPSEF